MTETAQEGIFLGDWLWWTPESVVPARWNRHLPFFAWLFANVQPAVSVELGSGTGESFRALCQITDRFSPGGRLVGVDHWTPHRGALLQTQSEYDQLVDYCSTHHPSRAALLRMDPNEAAGEFSDAGVDLLHVVADGRDTELVCPDIAAWAPKVRPGGVIVMTCGPDPLDDASRKLWSQVVDSLPTVSLSLPGVVGVAQAPDGQGARLVDTLKDHADGASSLFRSLGERLEYRHLIGSEPTSASGLRQYISDLMDQHAEDVRRLAAESRLGRERLEGELAALSERLVSRSQEVTDLESEVDMLMAKVAAQAATYERQLIKASDDLAHLQWAHSNEIAQLLHTHATDAAVLHGEIATREQYIQDLTHSTSWRVTRPLRRVQSIRMKTVRRPR